MVVGPVIQPRVMRSAFKAIRDGLGLASGTDLFRLFKGGLRTKVVACAACRCL